MSIVWGLKAVTIYFRFVSRNSIFKEFNEITKTNHTNKLSQTFCRDGAPLFAKNIKSDALITLTCRYITLHTHRCLSRKCTDHESATKHLKLYSISVETVRHCVKCSVLYITPSNNWPWKRGGRVLCCQTAPDTDTGTLLYLGNMFDSVILGKDISTNSLFFWKFVGRKKISVVFMCSIKLKRYKNVHLFIWIIFYLSCIIWWYVKDYK